MSLRNTLIFACLILLGMLAMGGFNPDFGKDTRPDVVPLTVPAYPNARRSTVAPLSGSPNMLFGSRTTFTTTDSPETLSAWYTTTMHGMGWGDVGNSTSDQTMILFDDYRGCPGASARIDWDAPVSGITTVEIEYYTAACRR